MADNRLTLDRRLGGCCVRVADANAPLSAHFADAGKRTGAPYKLLFDAGS